MNNASLTIQIDPTITGRIRRLNGGCLAPPIYSENAGKNIREEFTALRLPITRLHDAPLSNPGLNLVDVPMIFPLFHADHEDPRNYNFKATDDYIQNCIDCGTQVFYRLGVSIDHSFRKYVIDPPADPVKWVEIVSRIIRHYNEGWADGFHHNIIYWEIWNEAEGVSGENLPLRTMWNGSTASYNDFYVQTATLLKARFPHLKIGGPSHCCWSPEVAEAFLDACIANNAPLDFYSYHSYIYAPEKACCRIRKIRAFLDRKGFTQTELHLTEWQYLPHNGFAMMRENHNTGAENIFQEMKSEMAAAFVACNLCLWQDEPLDMGYLYTVDTSDFGLFKPFSFLPAKNYFAMKAFGELAAGYPDRIDVKAEYPADKAIPTYYDSHANGIGVLGGQAANGDICILAAIYRYALTEVVFKIPSESCTHWELFVLDHNHDLSPVQDLTMSSDSIKATISGNSAVFLLKGYKLQKQVKP